MAVTGQKNREINESAAYGAYQPNRYQYQQIQNTAPAGQQASMENNGLRGVSENTRNQQNRYQSYQQGDRVNQMQKVLQDTLANKPQAYKGKYSDALDSILQEIQNPEKFNYSFNGDEMFKQYADLYTQLGRQASMDAMGQAAGLTGGYGNSYAEAAGNQAYQQYLLRLYEQGGNLRQQAYNEYLGEQDQRMNRLAALQQADSTDYARYRDTVGDWQNERDYYTNAEERAYNRDYEDFLQNRAYWSDQAQQENADYWNAANFNEAMRNNDANRDLQIQTANAENQYRYDQLEENQAQYGADYAERIREYDTSMEEDKRQFDTSMEENKRQYDTSMAENQRQFDASMAENQRQFEESVRQFNETSKLDWAKLEENKRQYDAGLSEEQRQYNRNLAVDYVNAILANGQMPSAELLVAAGLSQEDAQKLMAQLIEDVGGGGGGGSGGGSRSSGTTVTSKTNSGGANSKNFYNFTFASGNQNVSGTGANKLVEGMNSALTKSGLTPALPISTKTNTIDLSAKPKGLENSAIANTAGKALQLAMQKSGTTTTGKTGLGYNSNVQIKKKEKK